MRRSPAGLAVVLTGFGLVLTWAVGVVPRSGEVMARLALFAIVPLVAGGIASALVVDGRRLVYPALVRVPALRNAPLLAALVGLDLAPIGVGYLRDWMTFTYGDQRLATWRLAMIALAPVSGVAIAVLGSEWALRVKLFGAWAEAGHPVAGGVASVVAGTALALPAIVPGFAIADPAFVGAAIATAVAREASAVLLYRRGGVLLSGTYRGVLAGVEALLISDWYSFYFPGANYVSSDPRFYAVRAAGPLLALCAAALWTISLDRAEAAARRQP